MLKKHNKSKPRLICSLLLVNKLYNQVSAFYQNKAEKSMTSIVSLQKNIYSEKIPLSIRVLYILVCVSTNILCKRHLAPSYGVLPVGLRPRQKYLSRSRRAMTLCYGRNTIKNCVTQYRAIMRKARYKAARHGTT